MEAQDNEMRRAQPGSEIPFPTESALCRADRLGRFITSLPKWTAVAVIVWQAGISIGALADRSAVPSLLIARFWRQASYWEVVCWIAAIVGILFGLYCHRLLRRQSALDTARLKALEQRLNLLPETAGTRPTAKH